MLRLPHDPYEAEGLTQGTFLRLFRHLRDKRPLDNPIAWLFTVAHNLAVDKIRDETHFYQPGRCDVEQSRKVAIRGPFRP